MNRFYTGALLCFLSATCFAVMPILAKYAYASGANVPTLLFLRFGLATVFFFLYLWLKKSLSLSISKKQWFALFFFGGLIYALISTMYFQSLHYISGSLATLLLYTYPIFVILLSLLLEKKGVPKKIVIPIVLSMVGMVLVLGTSFHAINSFGVLLALGSSFGYAVHIVLMNRMVKQLPPFLTTAFVILFTTVSMFVMGIGSHQFDFHFGTGAWASIIGLSLASTILALLAFFAGLQLIGSTNASILSMLEPILTIVLSALILGESFTGVQMIGTIAVLAGAVMVVRGEGLGEKEVQSHSV